MLTASTTHSERDRVSRSEAHRRAGRRGRGVHHRLPDASTRLEVPPMVTVFSKPDGGLFHSWCGQPLDFRGRRAGLELDFYCLRCVEHVALPESVLDRVPVRHNGD